MSVAPLLVDIYPGDRRLDCDAFCAAGAPWHGIIAKASQGTRYRYDAWLFDLVTRFRRAAGSRYGADLFDGFYAYLMLDQTGAPQVDTALDVIRNAGGEGAGTLPLMLDVERGGQRDPDRISRAQVEDVTHGAAARYTELTGREATLYGGELLRGVGVRDRLGCGRSAVACYGPQLRGRTGGTAEFLRATGTDVEHTLLWQYVAAEGVAVGPAGYPTSAPGIGRCDISTLLTPGGIEALRAGLWAERPAA